MRFDGNGPVLPVGRKIESVLLVGHAALSLWTAFERFRKSYQGPDPLDHWSKQVVDPIAAALGCVALYPFERPWWPFQQWIAASEGLKPSPLGILIHPEFGLWHGYRAALTFDRSVEVTEPRNLSHPFDSCDNRPCLAPCPAGAVSDRPFDVAGCRAYLGTELRADDLHSHRLSVAQRLSGRSNLSLRTGSHAVSHAGTRPADRLDEVHGYARRRP